MSDNATQETTISIPPYYGDPSAEYDALVAAAGLVDLPQYGVVEMTGDDREQFLSGMVTNEVRGLAPSGGCRATLLTVHGKLVASLVVVALADRILLLTEAKPAAEVIEYLDKYLIADDVELADRSEELALLAICGPEAGGLLNGAGFPAPEALWSHEQTGLAGTCIRWKLAANDAWALLLPREEAEKARAALLSAGAVQVGFDALNAARIEAGIPWFGVDATEESFPLETRLDDAISTSKGCYLGQETIIRILHRGHVNRKLLGLVFPGNTVPPAGSEVSLGGATVGAVTSAVRSPYLGVPVALALLKLKGVEPGALVEVDTPEGRLPATVSELPFSR